MVVKTKQGYQVKSEKGKNLSKPNLTKKQTQKRLKQVEYYKRKVGDVSGQFRSKGSPTRRAN